MVDFLSKKQRSERMSRIRGRDTAPEKNLRMELHRLGLRYRLHARDLPGKPDLKFPRFKSVVMVHGCFWHRHSGCPIATTPKSNTAFWLQKFQKNVRRDSRVRRALGRMGWRVMVVWECQVSSKSKARKVAARIEERLQRNKGR